MSTKKVALYGEAEHGVREEWRRLGSVSYSQWEETPGA